MPSGASSTSELRMSSAEPQVLVARAAVARVLGIDESTLRADSPLVPLGWDSLACVCWTGGMDSLKGRSIQTCR